MKPTVFKSFCLIVLLAGIAIGCVPEQTPVIKVESVAIKPGDVTLTEGETTTLTAEVLPKDATDKTVKWSSSDERIVMVSSSGKVLAIAAGKAAITAKAEDKTDIITVTVVAKPIPVTGISLDKASIILTAGEHEQVTATITPANATNKNVSWTSSDTKVATVADGTVTGVGAGTATITAKAEDGGKTAECTVTVKPKAIPTTTISADHVSAVSAVLKGKAEIGSSASSDLEVGFQYSTSPGILPSNSIKVLASGSNADYTYTSDVTGLDPETTYYYRSYVSEKGLDNYGETKSFKTKALSTLIKTLSVTDMEAKWAALNAMLDLTDVLAGSKEYGFLWGMSENGLDQKLGGGKLADKTYSAPLENLTPKTQYWYKSYVTLDSRTYYGEVLSFTTGAVLVTSVSLDREDYVFDTIGNTIVLKATVLPEDAQNKQVTWSSSDPGVATVNANGRVEAVDNGEATITVRTVDQGKTATCYIIVDQMVTGLSLDKTSLSLNEGKTAMLNATVTPDNAHDPTLAWTSSDYSVATVDRYGKVTAVSKGTATITATTQDGSELSASCSVRVIRPVTSIRLISYPVQLLTGSTKTIEAEAEPSTADNTGIDWSSSDPSIATVSDGGVVTAVSPGTVTITGTAQDGNGASNSFELVVIQLLTDLTLSTSSLSLTEGGFQRLTATVAPANATDRSVRWTSSNQSVVKVSSSGVVMAVAPGTATITVYANDNSGLSADCSVSVNPQPEPEMVDLGLSVRWASFNIGASAPEEGGGFYAWGETDSKMDYTWATYKFNRGGDYLASVQYTKYNSNSYWGTVDYKTTLDLQDDVARVKLGGSWRMPTKSEFLELCSSSNCTWETMTLNGVYGSKVTSKIAGYTDKWIFLPAAGRMHGQNMEGGGCGFYLSSTRDSEQHRAYSLAVIDAYLYGNTLYRCEGLSVRPVSVEVHPVTSITLSSTSLSLDTGQSATLTVTYAPSNATNKSVTWSSSNTSVATVSSSGVVTAVSAGSATITATANDGNGASAQCQVTVTPPGPKAVDLGLSVKWASCNVGATYPEEYGNYYAWGETTTKSGYSWGNYKFRTGGSTYSDLQFSKYNSLTGYGTVDKKTVLDLSDDVARVEWGGSWRMPTRDEFDELADNCTWEYTSINGVYGQKLTSKIEGYTDKWIFLPAAGRQDGSSSVNVGSRGYYWTSSHSIGWSDKAYDQFFNTQDQYITVLERYFGLTVRPVRK